MASLAVDELDLTAGNPREAGDRVVESRYDWSCANTSLVVTGPDRFLVAYSDFRHRDAEGRPCKAIAVREVVVTARPGR